MHKWAVNETLKGQVWDRRDIPFLFKQWQEWTACDFRWLHSRPTPTHSKNPSGNLLWGNADCWKTNISIHLYWSRACHVMLLPVLWLALSAALLQETLQRCHFKGHILKWMESAEGPSPHNPETYLTDTTFILFWFISIENISHDKEHYPNLHWNYFSVALTLSDKTAKWTAFLQLGIFYQLCFWKRKGKWFPRYAISSLKSATTKKKKYIEKSGTFKINVFYVTKRAKWYQNKSEQFVTTI